SLRADGHQGAHPPAAGDSAPAADRNWRSAAGKTRNPLVPVAAQTAGPLASCPPDTAQFVPRSPSPEDLAMQRAYGGRVRRPEWLMACPVAPLTSLNTFVNWIFIWNVMWNIPDEMCSRH